MKELNKLINFISEKQNFLFENKKECGKFLKEYVQLLKNNKILFEKYHLINKLNEGINENIKEEFITDVINVFNNNFTKKDIKESEIKLNKVINDFLPKTLLEEYNKSVCNDELCESFDVLFTKNLNTKNIEQLISCKKYINENIKTIKPVVKTEYDIIIEKVTPDVLSKKLIEKFNLKYDTLLKPEEKTIFKKILESNTDEKKVSLLNELKSDCLIDVNELLKECDDVNFKEKLLILKEKLLSENNNDFYENITKLIETKQLLQEIKE